MSERQDFIATEKCAKAFMSRSEHPENVQRVWVPRFLNKEGQTIPGFRLPFSPCDCCDLCKELQKLVVRAIGPDPRFESIQALFFPSSQCLVLKLHVPKDINPVNRRRLFLDDYFAERCFYIYSHPGVPCSLGLFKPYPFQKLEWAFSELQKCALEHDCYGKDPTPLPTRVIKVGRGPDDVRLQRGGVCARYICLSHCWGSKQPLITTKQNIDNHLACIVWEDMPLLYQDTIRLAWRLGIEYVWIDSLCIIQNSQDDWAHEAGRMKSVYGNSWLTVAASSNPDCSDGILDKPGDGEAHARFASVKDCLQYSGITRENEHFSWLAVPADINKCEDEKHEKGVCRWPLLTRGWVLQERLLSPRVLYFSAASLVWSCKEDEENENSVVGRCPPPAHLGKSTMHGTGAWLNSSHWLDIIEDYSKLKLTNPDDRLAALSGFAQEASQRMPPGAKYLAGLWRSSLFQGLSWYNVQESHRGGILTECSRQPSQVHQGTPSWSWAAITGGVLFPRVPCNNLSTIFHAQICGTKSTPASRHDPTGRVKNGMIHLRGPISPIINSDPTLINNLATTIYFDCPVHMDFNYIVDNKIKCLPLYTGKGFEKYTRVEVQYSVGLLLQPVEGKDWEYRKVALVIATCVTGLIYDPLAWFCRLSHVEDVVIV